MDPLFGILKWLLLKKLRMNIQNNTVQCGPPVFEIAKLIYNSNNYGLLYAYNYS